MMIHFTQCEHLINLTDLSIHSHSTLRYRCPHQPMTKEDVKLLSNCKYLTNLTRLDLSGNGIGEEGVKHLFESKYFTKLTDLSLLGVRVDTSVFSSMANSSILQNLTSLQLPWTMGKTFNMANTETLAIVQSIAISNMKHLSFRGTSIDNQTISHLVHNPSPQLTSLNLEMSQVEPEVLRELATCPQMNHLKAIYLENLITGPQVGLAECRLICEHSNLTRVSLSRIFLRDEIFVIIAAHLKNLTDLKIAHCGNNSIHSLCTSPNLSQLRVLNLSDRGYNYEQVLNDIALSKYLTNLTELHLDIVMTRPLSEILWSENMSKLHVISLLGAKVQVDALERLVKMPNLYNLKKMYLSIVEEEMVEVVGKRFELVDYFSLY